MPVDSADNQNRVSLTLKVMEILSDWKLTASQQCAILAMPSGTRTRHMHQYKEGVPFPESTELDGRADHIVGIADALRTSYPLNLEMGSYWLRQTNKRYGGRTPLASMLEDGLDGVLAVRTDLDCAYGWHLDDQKTKNNLD